MKAYYVKAGAFSIEFDTVTQLDGMKALIREALRVVEEEEDA